MTREKTVGQLQKRYDKLTAQLAKSGPIIQGTITERVITKKDSRNPTKTRTIGPYYQWTFKNKGKTVTVNLAATQSKHFQRAIDNNKKTEKILSEMRDISRQILDATTDGVKRRNSLR